MGGITGSTAIVTGAGLSGAGTALTPLVNSGALSVDSITGAVSLSSLAAFTKSLGANGYQKLPGGLIIQWGKDNSAGGGEPTVTFPIAFPSAVVSITTGAVTNAAGASWVYQERIRTNYSTSGFGYQSSTDGGMFWIALGY